MSILKKIFEENRSFGLSRAICGWAVLRASVWGELGELSEYPTVWRRRHGQQILDDVSDARQDRDEDLFPGNLQPGMVFLHCYDYHECVRVLGREGRSQRRRSPILLEFRLQITMVR